MFVFLPIFPPISRSNEACLSSWAGWGRGIRILLESHIPQSRRGREREESQDLRQSAEEIGGHRAGSAGRRTATPVPAGGRCCGAPLSPGSCRHRHQPRDHGAAGLGRGWGGGNGQHSLRLWPWDSSSVPVPTARAFGQRRSRSSPQHSNKGGEKRRTANAYVFKAQRWCEYILGRKKESAVINGLSCCRCYCYCCCCYRSGCPVPRRDLNIFPKHFF